MIPAETRWAVKALEEARDRLATGQEVLIPNEAWALDLAVLFSATAEALMWVVVLDDWYQRDHAQLYRTLTAERRTLLVGLRWARNRTLHQFAVITGFTRRPPVLTHIHPGWQKRALLPASTLDLTAGRSSTTQESPDGPCSIQSTRSTVGMRDGSRRA